MNYTVLRNTTHFTVNLWNLRNDDLVLAQNGYFYPVYSFPELSQYFPKSQLSFSESLAAVGLSVLVTVGIVGTLVAIGTALQPSYNDIPLSKSIKNYIRERDEEICFYCDEYAPNGHVDHRKSRYNGGSNDLDNLTWACAGCNCSKGPMNDTDYIMLLESYC